MAYKHHIRLKDDRGFTLVELMVALVMATIFILATMTIAEISTQSYRAQERVSDAQQGVRGMLDPTVLNQSGAAPGALVTPATDEPEAARKAV